MCRFKKAVLPKPINYLNIFWQYDDFAYIYIYIIWRVYVWRLRCVLTDAELKGQRWICVIQVWIESNIWKSVREAFSHNISQYQNAQRSLYWSKNTFNSWIVMLNCLTTYTYFPKKTIRQHFYEHALRLSWCTFQNYKTSYKLKHNLERFRPYSSVKYVRKWFI